MKPYYILICCAFITFYSCNNSHQETLTEQPKIEAFSIGEIQKITSKILNEERILNIYLPNSYNTDSINKKYPVIYVLDGSKDEDFIHISGLVQFGSFSWINMIPESIVVGISNVDRRRDFTAPTSIKEDLITFPTSGRSTKFISFIDKELQPFIDKSYRTTETKTIIGQSLGGLLATEILFTKPNLFNNYLIVSPSLWWNNQYLLNKNPQILQANFNTKKNIFIAVGKEGEIMERDANSLYYMLQKGKNNMITTYFEFFEKQNHGDALHLAAYNGLKEIFSTQN